MSEARIVAETDDYIDVQLLGVEEMEVAHGMTLAEWTRRYVAAAEEAVKFGMTANFEESAAEDFLMIEGSPEVLGRMEGIRFLVFMALDNANERMNYDMHRWTADEIAEDRHWKTPALAGFCPQELAVFVEDWLLKRSKA